MRAFIGLAILILVGACSESTNTAPEAPAAPVAAPELALDVLAVTDGQGLNGELGCSFRSGEDALLIAMGFVASQDHSEAAAKRNGAVVRLVAAEDGGFDALSDGATFAGEGLTANVAIGAANETGNEQVEHAATLTARAHGAERVYEGTWTCGP